MGRVAQILTEVDQQAGATARLGFDGLSPNGWWGARCFNG